MKPCIDSTFLALMEQSLLRISSNRGKLCCPISGKPFECPIVLEGCGHSVDRDSLRKRLQIHKDENTIPFCPTCARKLKNMDIEDYPINWQLCHALQLTPNVPFPIKSWRSRSNSTLSESELLANEILRDIVVPLRQSGYEVSEIYYPMMNSRKEDEQNLAVALGKLGVRMEPVPNMGSWKVVIREEKVQSENSQTTVQPDCIIV